MLEKYRIGQKARSRRISQTWVLVEGMIIIICPWNFDQKYFCHVQKMILWFCIYLLAIFVSDFFWKSRFFLKSEHFVWNVWNLKSENFKSENVENFQDFVFIFDDFQDFSRFQVCWWFSRFFEISSLLIIFKIFRFSDVSFLFLRDGCTCRNMQCFYFRTPHSKSSSTKYIWSSTKKHWHRQNPKNKKGSEQKKTKQKNIHTLYYAHISKTSTSTKYEKIYKNIIIVVNPFSKNECSVRGVSQQIYN